MELGYTFYPAKNPGALGHSRLDVNLYAAPTGKHFDPLELHIPIFDQEHGIYRLNLTHPVATSENQICAGRIILINFSRNEAEGFSFGGRITFESAGNFTQCRLESAAPIFDLGQFSDAACDLVSEYESQLALLKADWHGEDFEFEQRLAGIEPRVLFIALTAAIEERLQLLPAAARDDHYRDLQHNIRSAVRFINADGILPTDGPTIQELLSKT